MSGTYASRRHAAYHEAGHAIARLSAVGDAPSIAIFDDGSGRCDGECVMISDLTYIAYTLAGPVAEARIRKQSPQWSYERGGCEDYDLAADRAALMASSYGMDEREMFYEGERYARFIIGHFWLDVARLAFAVLDRGRLSNAEVSEIAGSAITRQPYRQYLRRRFGTKLPELISAAISKSLESEASASDVMAQP